MSRRALFCLAVACSATPAFAHAFLNHADPGAGATLTSGPKRVMLTFSEELEPVFSGMAVTDQSGRDVDAGKPMVDGNCIFVPVRALPPGKYRVVWHAVSVDTHRTEGAYSFMVKR